MNNEDAAKVDKKISVDLFMYVYAVASKARTDDNDDAFMAQLQQSLRSFHIHKSEAANTLFSFDTGADTSSKLAKGETGEKKQKEKSTNVTVSLPECKL